MVLVPILCSAHGRDRCPECEPHIDTDGRRQTGLAAFAGGER